jgi:hypothetical protein
MFTSPLRAYRIGALTTALSQRNVERLGYGDLLAPRYDQDGYLYRAAGVHP